MGLLTFFSAITPIMSSEATLHSAEGELKRGEGESRIDFLSKVRNKALEPLWTPADSSNQTMESQPAAFPADRILYMNDVFVCARDFIRLMLHNADMVCALDFWQRNSVSLPELVMTDWPFQNTLSLKSLLRWNFW